MYTAMMSAFGGSLWSFVRPVQSLNQMAIAHVEKVVAFQLDSATTYTNLAMGRLKTAAEVNDPWSFMRYMTTQGAYMTKVGEQVISDLQKMSQLSGEFLAKAQSVAQEQARSIGGTLSEAGKGAAKKVA